MNQKISLLGIPHDSDRSKSALRKNFEGNETHARYGFTTQADDYEEYQFSHAFGTAWDGGNIIVSYEFHHRDQLLNKHRPYSRSRDFRSFGGRDYRLPYGSPGNILTPTGGVVPLYAVRPNQNGQNLTREDLLPPTELNYYNFLGDNALFPRQTQNGLYSHISQNITSSMELFAEARYAHRKIKRNRSSPNIIAIIPPENPYYFDAYGTGAPVRVAYSLDDFYKPEYQSRVNS